MICGSITKDFAHDYASADTDFRSRRQHKTAVVYGFLRVVRHAVYRGLTLQFTDRMYDATIGEYRDDLGRLVDGGNEYQQQITGQALNAPLHSTPDIAKKLPSMMDIYSTRFMKSLRKSELDLAGYTGEEVLEWNFQGVGV